MWNHSLNQWSLACPAHLLELHRHHHSIDFLTWRSADMSTRCETNCTSVAMTELCWQFTADIWRCCKLNCLTLWQNSLTPSVQDQLKRSCRFSRVTSSQVDYWTCRCLKVKSGAGVLVNRHTGISLILLDNTNTGDCQGLALISLVLSQHAEFVGLAEGF